MVYSDINDVKALIGFTLDANSLPTIDNAALIQGHAYNKINGHIGGVQTVDNDLKSVETDLVVAHILAIHSKRPFPMRFTAEHKVILDNYRDVDLVSRQKLHYGYD